jgi:oligoendopeptidase F
LHTLALTFAAMFLAAAPGSSPAQAPAAAGAPADAAHRWRLSDLFPSDEAWANAKVSLARDIKAFGRYQGHLGDSPRGLGDALADMGALQNRLQRVSVYAQARNDEDTREARPRAMSAEAVSLSVALDTATSWVRPELIALPPARIQSALAKEPRLRPWSFFLEDVLRWRAHTLPAGEERVFAMTGETSSAPGTIYGVLKDADLPYPTVKLSTGEALRLDPAAYTRARTSPDRADRLKVFQSFFAALKDFQRTMGSTLYAQVQAHVVDGRVHRFDSSLEAALFRDNVPVGIYRQLIKDVNANLPTLHRYLALRRRMLGLPELGYEDLYTPLVRQVDRRYTIDQGMAMTLDAVAPLGAEYQRKLEGGYKAGWTDFLPRTGKRAGAYSTGVYGVHPFQLLNFNGQWEDVSTLAHESGHSMHTLLTFEHQPFATSAYATFVAEIASTLNENLLFRRALAGARSDQERLALLGERLEGLRTTLFRQTMFAEFELAIHERVEKGEALTGEALSASYLTLVRRYYGHDRGICRVADLYGDEWTFVPHFYYDFYVYQYATSVVASSALAKAILDDEAHGGTAARDRYLAMLAAGGSAYPADLLKRAGVDLTTPGPFNAAIEEMNAVMTQIESLLPPERPRPATGTAH